jgi:hypothetical protein
LIRARKWDRPKRDSVEDRETGGGGTDPECQGHDEEESEHPLVRQLARGEAEVLDGVRHGRALEQRVYPDAGRFDVQICCKNDALPLGDEWRGRGTERLRNPAVRIRTTLEDDARAGDVLS